MGGLIFTLQWLLHLSGGHRATHPTAKVQGCDNNSKITHYAPGCKYFVTPTLTGASSSCHKSVRGQSPKSLGTWGLDLEDGWPGQGAFWCWHYIIQESCGAPISDMMGRIMGREHAIKPPIKNYIWIRCFAFSPQGWLWKGKRICK